MLHERAIAMPWKHLTEHRCWCAIFRSLCGRKADVSAMLFQCRNTQEFIDGMLRCKGNARAIDQAGLESTRTPSEIRGPWNNRSVLKAGCGITAVSSMSNKFCVCTGFSEVRSYCCRSCPNRSRGEVFFGNFEICVGKKTIHIVPVL